MFIDVYRKDDRLWLYCSWEDGSQDMPLSVDSARLLALKLNHLCAEQEAADRPAYRHKGFADLTTPTPEEVEQLMQKLRGMGVQRVTHLVPPAKAEPLPES